MDKVTPHYAWRTCTQMRDKDKSLLNYWCFIFSWIPDSWCLMQETRTKGSWDRESEWMKRCLYVPLPPHYQPSTHPPPLLYWWWWWWRRRAKETITSSMLYRGHVQEEEVQCGDKKNTPSLLWQCQADGTKFDRGMMQSKRSIGSSTAMQQLPR